MFIVNRLVTETNTVRSQRCAASRVLVGFAMSGEDKLITYSYSSLLVCAFIDLANIEQFKLSTSRQNELFGTLQSKIMQENLARLLQQGIDETNLSTGEENEFQIGVNAAARSILQYVLDQLVQYYPNVRAEQRESVPA
jgi:hypothetical protein